MKLASFAKRPGPGEGGFWAMWFAVVDAIGLLPSRAKRSLVLLLIAQVATGLLDLIGVALIGLMAAVAITSTGDDSLPGFLHDLLRALGVNDTEPVQLAVAMAGIATLFFVAKSVIYAVLQKLSLRRIASWQADISSDLARRLFRLPLQALEERSSQETSYALTGGAFSAVTVILSSVTMICSELVLLVTVGVLLLVVNPFVTVALAVSLLAITAIMNLAIARITDRNSRDIATAVVYAPSAVQEGMAAYREITVLNRREEYLSKVYRLLDSGARGYAMSNYIAQIPRVVFEAALVVIASSTAIWQFTAGDPRQAVGTLAVVLAAGFRLMPSLLRLNGQVIVLRNAVPQAQTTFDLAQRLRANVVNESEFVSPQDGPRAGASDFVATVSLQGVSFRYADAKEMTLQDISLEVGVGESLAIVGPTGSGKSTLVDIVLGLHDPQTGRVELGGEVPRVALRRWPGRIAYVPQQVGLINGSVRENVALGLSEEEIDDDQVWSALKAAHLEDLLVEARDGLDTMVGERGVRFSGGQRQRLGLARALYTRPQLLVLDEATSALDAETEAQIADTLEQLVGKVTTIVIAHRLATVRHADQVVLIDSGVVVARGTFDEVRAAHPGFDRQAALLGITR